MALEEPAGEVTVVRSDSGAPICRIVGDLDLATVAAARAALREALSSGTSPVLADLSGVGFCDSAGLNLLLQIRLEAENAGVDLRLLALSPPVARVLELTGALGLFQVEPPAVEEDHA